MTIKRKLQLCVIVTGGVALLAFSLTLVWISQQVSETIEQHRAINKIVNGVFELHLVTNDYLLHHEERAHAQWQTKWASLGQVLTEVKTESPEGQAILDQIIQNHAGLPSLFSRLVANHENLGLSEEEIALSLDVERRLVGQLSVYVQMMVSQALQLAEMASARVESAQGRGSFLLPASGVIILTLMVSTIVLVSNNIVAGITNLHRGSEIIAAGDLDYQVDVGSRDEIGDLARAFNEMTRQLRESYMALKEEIAERELAVSQRDAALEALREYSERLEEMVEERTRELRDAQEQLVRQEKLAVLGQLAGGVGHELRNPLGVISNAVYFLQTILPPGEWDASSDADETMATTREYIEIINSEVRNAEKIVSDLLDFSRTRSAEREEVAISELVIEALDSQLPPKKVEVTTQIPSDLPPVFVDSRQIGQVLINLITNAYQAMTLSSPRLETRAEGSAETPDGGNLTISAWEEKDRVLLSVADTGCGISPENMKKIFEPLFTTRARGIGLGLAVSRNLVEINGGSIEVESTVGEGTMFTVRLPTR